MKLVPRLLVLGVAIPIAGLVVAVLIAGTLFRRSLVQAVDERLFAQAAVESVSLFDGPDRKPHLHLAESPLAAEVAAFAPTSTLFDPEGNLVVGSPGRSIGMTAPAQPKPGEPRLDTPDSTTRTLTVGVDRPGDGVYTLHLVASLAPVDAAMASFYRSVGGTVGVITLLLLGVLYHQARRLTRRIRELIAFVPLLRSTKPPENPPAPGSDELAELGVTLTDAARVIADHQSAQERFLANAAHQLRTPLAVLAMEIDVALRKPREAPELRDALEHARTETDRLTLLARKLLDFESLRTLKPEQREVDLRLLVREVVERHLRSAEAKSIVVREHGDAVLLCNCDPLLISQALENLIDNALRFAPRGSAIEVFVKRSGQTCSISVHDDGPGIPREEEEKIFEPFFRGSSPGSQTGLGLAFVADVARKHGGCSQVERADRGTTIRIDLPWTTLG